LALASRRSLAINGYFLAGAFGASFAGAFGACAGADPAFLPFFALLSFIFLSPYSESFSGSSEPVYTQGTHAARFIQRGKT
jgi:hypothetical protein